MHFINVFSYLKERLKKVIAIEELNWHALMSAIHENIVRLRSVKWSNIVKNHVFWIRCISSIRQYEHINVIKNNLHKYYIQLTISAFQGENCVVVFILYMKVENVT